MKSPIFYGRMRDGTFALRKFREVIGLWENILEQTVFAEKPMLI